MTKVFFKKKRGSVKTVEVSGHAGFAQEGEDIVCAAITSAVQLVHILLDDVLLLDIDTVIQPDNTLISITLPDQLTAEENRAAQNAIKAFRLHAQALQEEYGQFINVMEVQFDA